MKFNEISQLVKLLEKSKLSELSYSDDSCKLTLKKAAPQAAPQPQVMQVPYPAGQGQPIQPGAAGSSTQESQAPVESKKDDNLKEITSPMVGTFYATPSPGAPPFVTKGSKISKGQVLCIIEAMKLMNEIEADISGVVEEIVMENETPVEFGTVLFKIRPE